MVKKILQLLSVSCSHRHTSQPFSAASRAASKNDDWDTVTGVALADGPTHYVVCFDCGKKLGYDWEQMRLVK